VTHFDTLTRRTKRKPRSQDALRKLLSAWCESHGGAKDGEPAHNSVLDAVCGGDYVLQSTIGPWRIHLPTDSNILVSINTRFENPTGPLPWDANQYSGKWNFNGEPGSEVHLFDHFTRCAGRYLNGA
jgi:hypothetical protein